MAVAVRNHSGSAGVGAKVGFGRERSLKDTDFSFLHTPFILIIKAIKAFNAFMDGRVERHGEVG